MSNSSSKRRLAALTASGLAAGALSFVAATTPASAETGTVTIDKTFTYMCTIKITVNDPSIPVEDRTATVGTFPELVRAESSIPATVKAGTTVPATPTTITLTMDDNLWWATKILTAGNPFDPGWPGVSSVDGSSSDSTIGVTVDGHRQTVPIDGLSVTGAPIPPLRDSSLPIFGQTEITPATPWTIPTSGMVRPIPVPATAGGKSLTLQMPDRFTADATLLGGASEAGDPMDFPTNMDCVIPSGAAAADYELLDSPIPITAADTTVSASAPAVAYGQDTRVSYKVSNVASGTVQVLEGTTLLATGTVAGGAGAVTLPRQSIGTHALTVKFLGNTAGLPSSTTTQVVVGKAITSITSAKIAPKKIKAKKTKAKLTVRLASTAGAPAGGVVVKLKRKTVGSAMLRNGTATIKLKKFAKKGKQTLTISYAGSGAFAASTKTIKVKVKK